MSRIYFSTFLCAKRILKYIYKKKEYILNAVGDFLPTADRRAIYALNLMPKIASTLLLPIYRHNCRAKKLIEAKAEFFLAASSVKADSCGRIKKNSFLSTLLVACTKGGA